MKKQVLYLAASALLLCACSAGKTPAAAPDSIPEVSASRPGNNSSSGELRLLNAGGSEGYYLIGQADANQLLCYIDYAQAIEVPLCTSPSCAHDSESCTAWIPDGEYISSLVCVNENTIALIRNPADGARTVEIADASGANRRVLYTEKSGEFLQTIACADDQALYCILETLSQQNLAMWLYRIPLDGSAAEPVGQLPDPVPELKGVSENSLVLYQFDWGDTTEEAQANGCENRIQLWDIMTGEEQILDEWHSDSGSNGRTLCWNDGKLWWTSGDTPDGVFWMDAQGNSGQTNVTWPEEITGAPEVTFTLEHVINDRVLITVWGPWGTDLLKRYAVDISGPNAAAEEIPLRFVSNASERPIEILAETDGGLLVHFAQQDSLTTQVQEDGYLAREFEISNRYGIISWNDFLAGTPNYREISVGGFES